MRCLASLALAVSVGMTAAGAAFAANPIADAPNWPCVQRKVPSLTPAAVWTGPVIEEGDEVEWRDDAEVAALVRRLSQRRLPMEEAKADVKAFAEGLGDDATHRLTLLFAGLFETMNAERGQIINGIERYGKRQKQLAEKVREMARETEALRQASEPDFQAIENAQTALLWETRIFNERRSTLPYVCELPRMVEQRLFALGREISKAVPKEK